MLPHPLLLERYGDRVRKAREALTDPAVAEEAAETLESLIDEIAIYIEGTRAHADVVGYPAGDHGSHIQQTGHLWEEAG